MFARHRNADIFAFFGKCSLVVRSVRRRSSFSKIIEDFGGFRKMFFDVSIDYLLGNE